MKKFAEFQYVRPDMEKIFARVSGDIAVLKEAKRAMRSLKMPGFCGSGHMVLETAKTVAHIRIRLTFRQLLRARWYISNSQMPKYEILKKRWER